jgi:hypothetical protein
VGNGGKTAFVGMDVKLEDISQELEKFGQKIPNHKDLKRSDAEKASEGKEDAGGWVRGAKLVR